MSDVYEDSLKMHAKHKGKIEVTLKVPLKSKEDLSLAYTPGVAEPCKVISKDEDAAYLYTIKQNTIAVVSDGTAVLGLGNIGALASLPVMEGKAALFKEFAGLDAFPICVDSTEHDIVETVRAIAPVFGGVNLEDIAAPRCFEIEEQLQDLGIPVMHDDQHGTAVVALSGVINGCKVVGKNIEDLRAVIVGAGAAGIAVTKILLAQGLKDVILLDSKGIVSKSRQDLNAYKEAIAQKTNPRSITGGLDEALLGADLFIGVSKPGLLTSDMVKTMAQDAMIFAMANPIPEIMPDEAHAAGAGVVATGRSDFPNQINNVLAFPGIFKGALDVRASRITEKMKVAAAHAIASCVSTPTREEIIPSPFHPGVAKKVTAAVSAAAKEEGINRV